MNVLVIDQGLNLELAITFARAGYNTGYHVPVSEAFRTGVQESIGKGFQEFEHFTDLDDALEFSDLVVFPDTFSKPLVNICKRLEIPTFGAGESEEFEHDRSFCKHLLERVGLPVGPYKELKGVESLENNLRQHPDSFVKLDARFRGTKETFHHVDWESTRRDHWGDLLKGLGANDAEAEFIVEQPIKSKVEIGCDTIVCCGDFGDPAVIGYEAKDKGYIGFFGKTPKIMADVDDKLAPYFKSTQAKTFWSNELRFTEAGKAYLLDPCVRTGHPVIEGELEMFKNLPQCIVNCALKDKVLPFEPAAKYVAIINVRSESLADDWTKVSFPKDQRRFVKLQNAKCMKGEYWVTPKSFLACAAVGLGNTPKEAISKAKDLAGEIECDGKHYDAGALDKLLEESVPAGEKLGINFK